MGKLAQKVAVITGGARGIGKQIALTFASEGADIVIADIIEMETVAQDIKNLGREVITIKTDVTLKEEVTNLIDTTIGNFRKVDILVNNAGITKRAPFLKMTEEDWDAVMDVNLKGAFLCTQAAAECMIKRKYGKIVNIASVAGLNAVYTPANYCVSKAGVIQLTKVSARELGPYGINVNAIAPGVVMTDIVCYQRTEAEVERYIEERKNWAVLGRIGTVEDIANVALFLASDESSFITGQVIAADGGRTGLTM